MVERTNRTKSSETVFQAGGPNVEISRLIVVVTAKNHRSTTTTNQTYAFTHEMLLFVDFAEQQLPV